MPVYEYKCPVCGDKEERIRGMFHRDDPVGCVSCFDKDESVQMMKRILSPTPGVVTNPAVPPGGRRGRG